AGKDVAWNRCEILGGQRLQCFRVVSVLALIPGQGKSDAEVRLPLLGSVLEVRPLDRQQTHDTDQGIGDYPPPSLGDVLRLAEPGDAFLGEGDSQVYPLLLELVQLLDSRGPVLDSHGRCQAIIPEVAVAQARVPIDGHPHVPIQRVWSGRYGQTVDLTKVEDTRAVRHHDDVEESE